MPAEKIAFRLSPMNISRANEATFQTLYEARVERSLDSLDLDEVFQNVNSLLARGDFVNFCAYEGPVDQPASSVRQVRKCLIAWKGQEVPGGPVKVKAVWVDNLVTVPQYEAPGKKPDVKKLDVVQGFDNEGFLIKDERGNVIERVDSKEQAEAFVASYDDKPKRGRPPKETKAA
jgi:hypothetical protein